VRACTTPNAQTYKYIPSAHIPSKNTFRRELTLRGSSTGLDSTSLDAALVVVVYTTPIVVRHARQAHGPAISAVAPVAALPRANAVAANVVAAAAATGIGADVSCGCEGREQRERDEEDGFNHY
jgi:hypothetical protein